MSGCREWERDDEYIDASAAVGECFCLITCFNEYIISDLFQLTLSAVSCTL